MGCLPAGLGLTCRWPQSWRITRHRLDKESRPHEQRFQSSKPPPSLHVRRLSRWCNAVAGSWCGKCPCPGSFRTVDVKRTHGWLMSGLKCNDLHAHDDEPRLDAKPSSWIYRSSWFIRRLNRGLVRRLDLDQGRSLPKATALTRVSTDSSPTVAP